MPSSPEKLPSRRAAAAAGSSSSGSSASWFSASLGAAVVLGLQALFIAVLSIVLAVSGFRPGTKDRAGAEILSLIGLASAVALIGLARGVQTRRRWARSPTLVLELICLPVAVTVIQGGR